MGETIADDSLSEHIAVAGHDLLVLTKNKVFTVWDLHTCLGSRLDLEVIDYNELSEKMSFSTAKQARLDF